MAMIKCKECGKNISDTAKVCVNCGAKTEKAKQQNKQTIKYIKITSIILLIIFIVILIVINNPIYKYKKQAKSILNDYLNNNITSEQAYKSMDNLRNEVLQQFDKNNNEKYLSLSSKLNSFNRLLTLKDNEEIKQELKDF